MPFSTYALINQYTVTGSAVSSFNFLDIPQTYTDLRLQIFASQGGSFTVYPNNDQTSNKSRTNLYVNSASSQGASGGASGNGGLFIDIGNPSYPSVTTVEMMSYAQTDKFKTFGWRWASGDASQAGNGFWVANWQNKTAISSLYCTSDTGGTQLNVGSTWKLYGIKRA